MAKYYDIDNDVRINGKLNINGDTSIPSSYNLLVGGNITGNIVSGNTAQITTINGTTANITNVTSTGTISGSVIKGDGSNITNLSSANMSGVLLTNGSRNMAGNLLFPLSMTTGNLYSYQINLRDTGHYIRMQYQEDDNATAIDGVRVAGFSGVELYANGATKQLAVFRTSGARLNAPLYVSGGGYFNGNVNVTGNIVSTGTVTGTFSGTGSALIVNGTTANGGTVPISNGWAYTHENKSGSSGHIPTGGTATTFLRGDNTWVVPTDTDTNNYVTSLSSTSGGNGTITVNRNGLTALTLDLTHNHDSNYYTETESDSRFLGISGMAVNSDKVDGLHANQLARGAQVSYSSVSGDDGTDGWYTLFTVSDASNTPILCNIRAYAHTSASFVVSKGYSTNNAMINLLQANTSSTNGSYKYLKGLRILTDGSLQVKLNGGATVSIQAQLFDNGTGTSFVTTLTKDVNATPSVGQTIDPLVGGSMVSNGNMYVGTNVVWHSGNFVPSSKADSSTLTTHSSTTGLGYHVPTGGTASTFLRGDGTWVTPTDTDTNNYIGSVSSTDGGNGTLTLNRSGLTALTIDLTHNHDSRYYTETETNTLLTGKDYYGKWNLIAGATTTGITASANVTVTGSGASSVSLVGNTLTISSIDTDTWRPIDTAPISGNTANSIASSWAYTHANTYGIGSHVPLGGTSTTFLRGDGAWITPTDTDTNNYISGVSSTDGGNGTLTLNRSGLTDLTIDLTHNHDGRYYTETETNTLLDGKDYYGKWNLIAGATTTGITASANVSVTGNGATSVSLVGNTLTVSSTDTNTWRAIDTSPISANTANSIASSWSYTHANTYGLGAHVPSGGSTTTFLRGDGTWVTPNDTDTYVTGLSSTAGGNGTLTVTRNTGGNLAIDLSHTHAQYVTNNTANQVVLTGFTMSGNSYVGTSTTAGALVVRTTSGASAIQLAGDNATQLSGTGVYMNASGNAKFSGTVTSNALSITSTGLVTNLNAEMVNGIKEKALAKNQSISELGGMGVYTGLGVSQQTVPNMTVLVSGGTAYTDSGMRVTYSNTSVSLSASSATYDRKDVVYVQGSSASANEGVVTVATGTPASTPAEPVIPTDAVKLAVVLVQKNIGSIQNSVITDARVWRPLYNAGGDTYLRNNLYLQGAITSTNGFVVFSEPIKNSATNTSLTFTAGTTSLTWTHNNALANYTVRLSCNSPEPHVYWSTKTTNAVTINFDDACESDVIVDVSIEAY